MNGGILSHDELLDALNGGETIWRKRDPATGRIVRPHRIARRRGTGDDSVEALFGFAASHRGLAEETEEADG